MDKRKLKTKKADISSRYWRTKADKSWSDEVRREKVCEFCGESSKKLDAHHILSKKYYPRHRHNTMNGVCLCVCCHKFSPQSIHTNCVFGYTMLKKRCCAKLAWAIEHIDDTDKITKPNYKQSYERLSGESL